MSNKIIKEDSIISLLRRQTIKAGIVIGIILLIFNSIYLAFRTKNDFLQLSNQYEAELKKQIKLDVENALLISDSIQDNLHYQTKKNVDNLIISTLETYKTSNEGYIFITDFEGNIKLGPGKNENVYNLNNEAAIGVVKKLIDKAKNGGGYVYYTTPGIDGKVIDKISFVLPMKNRNWYIGTGVDFDVISYAKSEVKNQLYIELLKQFVFLFIMIVLISYGSFFINKKTYSRVYEQLNLLLNYIKESELKHIVIPSERFFIAEFKVIAEKIQSMLDFRKEQNKNIEKQAFYDLATNIPNRYSLINRLQLILEEPCKEMEVCGAVILMDIDDFKLTNDTFGHSFGDKVLYEVAKRLEEESKSDFVARFGGDEFALIFKNIGSEKNFENKIIEIKNMFKKSFDIDSITLQFNVSIGVAVFPKDGTEATDLLRKADIAMYKVKESGRNGIMYFENSLLEHNNKYFYFERLLKKAIENDEIQLFYQPQIDSFTGEVEGLECLVRWVNNEGKIIYPNEFIPMAEKTGNISLITKVVIKKACEFLNKLKENYSKSTSISINVTTCDLINSNFILWLLEYTSHYNVSPHDIVIEVTESGLFENYSFVNGQIEKLQAYGYKLALDDFGTGYSSLTYITELSVDVIKIDKSFIDKIINNEKAKKMVMIIYDIARTLSLKVVAEGVETREQVELLNKMDINMIQGYFYSKPLPEDEIFNYFS